MEREGVERGGSGEGGGGEGREWRGRGWRGEGVEREEGETLSKSYVCILIGPYGTHLCPSSVTISLQ